MDAHGGRQCVIYTRQSVRSEGDLTSCEVQREMCLRFAKARGLRVSGERFDDEGISGATLERPALQRLLSAVRSGAAGAVVVHRLDRLSRRVRDSAALLEEFKAHNARLFIAAMPELADGAVDTLMLNILSAFAEFERDIIASRIRDTRAGLVARGRRIAGVTPFGYTGDRRTWRSSGWAQKECRRATWLRWPLIEAGRCVPAGSGQRGRCWIRSPILSMWAASERPRGRGHERTRRLWTRICSIAALSQSRPGEPVQPGAEFGAGGHRWRARCAVCVAAR
jgi:DNA invertase Pin-like site-specific DNA recombinase